MKSEFEELLIEDVLKSVWGFSSKDRAVNSLREALVWDAIQICHETGDRESFVSFVTNCVRQFLRSGGDDC